MQSRIWAQAHPGRASQVLRVERSHYEKHCAGRPTPVQGWVNLSSGGAAAVVPEKMGWKAQLWISIRQ